jgi:hypothetical protein
MVEGDAARLTVGLFFMPPPPCPLLQAASANSAHKTTARPGAPLRIESRSIPFMSDLLALVGASDEMCLGCRECLLTALRFNDGATSPQ